MRIKITHKLLMVIFFLLTILAFLFLRLTAQALTLPSNTFEVQGAQPSQTASASVSIWTYQDKIKEGLELIKQKNPQLKVGTKDIIFYERRISQNKEGKITISQKQIKEPEREVVLVILNTKTGKLDMITTIEKGDKLSVPSGYKIDFIERANGIVKNAWNTQRSVTQPADMVVILNVWPHFVTKTTAQKVKGKGGKITTIYKTTKTVENVIQSPYSDDLRNAELMEAGKELRKSEVQAAFDLLKERQVRSKTFPDKLVGDLTNILKPEFFERLPLLEQTDFAEFLFDPKRTLERVDIIIGANGDNAYVPTCSRAGACGWVQFTKPTYDSMRKSYPSAQLISDFETGARDHINSMMAAILLYDNNLGGYIKDFGGGILSDKNKLEEILASSYNGAPANAHKSLSASILQGLDDWITKYLKTETKEYIAKLRYIRDNYKD